MSARCPTCGAPTLPEHRPIGYTQTGARVYGIGKGPPAPVSQSPSLPSSAPYTDDEDPAPNGDPRDTW